MLFDVIIVFKGDDYVFKVLFNNLFFVISCFCYLFVLNEKNNLDIRRCKNIYCDCRLYYCFLCICLLNKLGRIREYFKKIYV